MIYSIRKKYFIALLLLALTALPGELGDLTRALVTDAYVQVSAFVAITLSIFYLSEHRFNFNVGNILRESSAFQIPIAAILGATPGCGGAVVVVAAYTSGNVSFGAVIATLTATMGDAAFLLIAKDPKIGFLIMIIGFFVGFISGVLVNKIHGKSFMKMNGCDIIRLNCKTSDYKASKTLDIFWIILLIPGIILGVLSAFQINLEEYFVNNIIEDPITFFGFLAGTLCLIMWIIPLISGLKYSPSKPDQPVLRRTVADTNFITTWVVLAFLTYELTVHLGNINLETMFQSYYILIPLIGVLIGFLPGCGPQILVTTLYLNGIIPLAAQIGNAISNDGDALFPAIALHPKAALIATIYSGVPAIIVSYAYFFSFEF